MTDGNTCTCRGYAAMHKPHPHADRDGSEARAQLEREHERGLAAYVPEPERVDEDRVRKYAAAVENAVLPVRVRQVMAVADAEQAELRALLGRVEALAVHVSDLHGELPEPHGAFTTGYDTALRDVLAIVRPDTISDIAALRRQADTDTGQIERDGQRSNA